MDPVSISTVVVATLKTIYSISTVLYGFAHSAKIVDTTIDALLGEVQSLSDVLKAIEEALKDPEIVRCGDGNLFNKGLGRSMQNAVEDCQHTVTALAELLIPLEFETEDPNSFKKAVKQSN